jgi:hypothetical protein
MIEIVNKIIDNHYSLMNLLFFLALLHRLQLTEISRQQIEEELCIVNKEKAEVIEQFQQVFKKK